MVMAGGSSPASHGNGAMAERRALHLAFHGMSAVEMDHLPLPEAHVQAYGQHFFQRNGPFCSIAKLRRTGNHVFLLKNTVFKNQLQTGSRILHQNGQRAALAVLIIHCGHSCHFISPCRNLMGNITEISSSCAVRIHHLNTGGTVIAHAGRRIFLRLDIQ